MTRYHGLQAGNPERKILTQQVEAGCESVRWQLSELTGAVERAAENPAKFNLTNEELSGRRRWIDNTRRQVDGVLDALKSAAAAPPPPSRQDAQKDRVAAANAKFVESEAMKQAMIVRQQDEQLDDIEAAVARIGRLGKAMGEELEGQQRLLGELDEDMDTTNSRLRATQKRMNEVIRAAGKNSQLCVIIFLSVVLVILSVIAFM
eukprot:CAMPEP_0202903680 /NCGR_PEP_ID=MMETSP1392-20130828/25747_1 /ASSEMBLY_ACC=CAM_ASM_000868 /TAXON_ID=225041 /ORGANISM="Chlamydomonas chlamydogama, Strain SAG 11-48b" /LENGTH=204 /DNA_ID=CAMNT_0049590977 /DNA_START=73 /DNA_END=687 /DNA_ORIENTATION=-